MQKVSRYTLTRCIIIFWIIISIGFSLGGVAGSRDGGFNCCGISGVTDSWSQHYALENEGDLLGSDKDIGIKWPVRDPFLSSIGAATSAMVSNCFLNVINLIYLKEKYGRTTGYLSLLSRLPESHKPSGH